MVEKGVPRKVAEEAAGELVDRVEVRTHPANYLHDVEFAKMLKMPLMNIHLPIDQITRMRLLRAIEDSKAKTVGELIRSLERIDEFRNAKTRIRLRMGKESNPLGKWVLLFAAWTNGGYPVAKAFFENGLDTVIYLHVDYDELVKLRRDCKGNLVVLGHMAGDSVGINIFLGALREKGLKIDSLGAVT